jgi:membrane protein YdbS with pleckstrin-like domain
MSWGRLLMAEMEKLPGKIKWVWALSAIGSLIVGLVVSGLIALFLPHWMALVALGLTLLEVVLELLAVPYRYRFSGYRISDQAVEISSGWLFKKQLAIPIARVQNVTLKAGPLLQMYGLQQVVVATAASSHDIEGLTPAAAKQLRDIIMARALEVKGNEL